MRKIPVNLLMADDDEDDRMMTREALTESHVVNNLYFVNDGEELIDYLHRRGKYSDPAKSPLPGLILLDLNMPRKSGIEALQEIRQDERWKHIPIVVLTNSKADEDILRSYQLGVNSFITKPVDFAGLVEVMKSLDRYWLEIVELPSMPAGG